MNNFKALFPPTRPKGVFLRVSPFGGLTAGSSRPTKGDDVPFGIR